VTLVPGRTRSADAEDESPHENVRLGKHESPERPAFLDLPPSTSLLELCEGCPKTALFQKHVAYGEYGVASGTCDANELVKAGGGRVPGRKYAARKKSGKVIVGP